METTHATGMAQVRQLVVSLRELAEATERVHFLQLSALVGEGYDPDVLDHLLEEYRAAKRRVTSARQARERWQQRSRAAGGTALESAPPTTADPSASDEPTPQLRFARWLVEHGRLSG